MKRARKKFGQAEEEGTPEWMVTYSDLVTLLLTFFVLLFSMATIDKQKFEEIATSLRSSFLHISNGEMFFENKGEVMVSVLEQNNAIDAQKSEVNDEREANKQQDSDKEAQENAKKLEDFKDKVESAIKELGIGNYVSVIDEEEIITLRLNSIVLFDSGSADIKDSGKDALKKLGAFLRKLDNEILIQGHTDNRPINTLLFPSNWELSTKRATNVVIFLVENCGLDPTKLTPTGNAEFRPVAPNDTEENRQKNRRIDIVIKK